MGPSSVGKVPQASSKTALYSAIAAGLDRVPSDGRTAYFREELGLVIGHNAAAKASMPHRAPQTRKGNPGRPGARNPKESNAIRDWLLVDEARLGIQKVLLRFPGDGSEQQALKEALQRTPGIRQVFETGHARDVFAMALLSPSADRRIFRARIEEIATRFYWEDVLEESHESAIGTWRALAREAGAEEGLLI
jgi:hypothetical protein